MQNSARTLAYSQIHSQAQVRHTHKHTHTQHVSRNDSTCVEWMRCDALPRSLKMSQPPHHKPGVPSFHSE